MEGRARSWWGWGYEDETVDESSLQLLKDGLQGLLGVDTYAEIRPRPPSTIELRPPRIGAPRQLAEFCSDDHLDRLRHTYGKAYVDVLRAVRGDFPNPPDLVAYPREERQIAELMTFCEAERIALTPYGGGSSVVAGVEPTESNRYRGAITLDMRYFDRILEVETVSRSANVEAGVLGPALEAGLKPFGLTLRHFPQSFEFSTVGGWIATRAGGHAASGPTRIDDVVTGIRMVTPRGVLETRRVPSSGAGPSPERLALGSEGTLGVITSAWLKVQPVPRHRASAIVHFRDSDQAVEAVRIISQADLWPSNCRLLSPPEAALTGTADGRFLELLLGFESHDRAVTDRLERALGICDDCHGTWERSGADSGEERSTGRWRRWFLQAPYLRDRLVLLGLIVETFETAVSWDRLSQLQEGVMSAATGAIEADGGRGIVTWRLNYVYPDGAAPYYTVVAAGAPGREIEQWRRIKAAVTDAILESGGTTTHHHAVGKEHRTWYDRERGPVWAAALEGVKRALDPAWILNPDVLIPADRASLDAQGGRSS
jgi:alkyldihydroxyacetonephosphate synthase